MRCIMLSILSGLSLSGTAIKAIAAGCAGVALIIALHFMIAAHDGRVLAEQAAAEQAARIVTINADHARAVAALQAQATKSALDAARLTSIMDKINAQPRTKACAVSPAIRMALDGLRTGVANGH